MLSELTVAVIVPSLNTITNIAHLLPALLDTNWIVIAYSN